MAEYKQKDLEGDYKMHYSKLWEYKNYLYLLLGNTLFNLGFMVYQVVFFWLAYDMTKSPVTAGWVILGSTVPYLVAGILGGVYADRWDRRKVILTSLLLISFIVLIIPILWKLHLLKIWHISMITFIVISIRCFFSPAIRALIPHSLPECLWAKGNSLFQIMTQLMRGIGPAIGGILIAQISPMLIFIIFSILSIIAFFILIPIKLKKSKKLNKNTNKIIFDIQEAFIFIKKKPLLKWSIFLFSCFLLFQTGMEKLGLPEVSNRIWGLGAQGFGIVTALFGIGNMIGAYFLGKITIKSFLPYISWGWIVWGVSFVLVGISPWYLLSFVFALIAGIAEAFNDLPMVLMIQKVTPDDKLGKVFSIWSTASFIGESGSSILAGVVIASLGLFFAFIATGFILAAIGLILFFIDLSHKRKHLVWNEQHDFQ